jgi:uncharacterized protein YjaG (DUF416 family)
MQNLGNKLHKNCEKITTWWYFCHNAKLCDRGSTNIAGNAKNIGKSAMD